MGYTYRWLRCNTSDGGCTAIQGATGSTYTLGSGDVGQQIRVEVTATNPDGSSAVRSEDSAIVAPKAGEDVSSSIPDSLVSAKRCQRILAGTGFSSQRVSGLGQVRLQVTASDYISPTAPLRVVMTGRKIKKTDRAPAKIVYRLDNKVIARPKKAPYSARVSPAQLASSRKHVLSVGFSPPTGKAHQMVIKITTTPCSTMFSAYQWRTATGTGLRLRVDSRSSLAGSAFKVPAVLLPQLKDAGRRAIGQARLALAGGRKVLFGLVLKKGDKTSTLLSAAAKAPIVRLTRTGISVDKLPAKVGILELTLYTQNKTNPKALLQKGHKAHLFATAKPWLGKPAKLGAWIYSQLR
jgi:hypothetical protein